MKENKAKLYFAYTGIFLVLLIGCYFVFFINERSLIWNSDGLTQHYNALAYYGEYLRDYLKGFLQGDFSLKEFDFSIGYGADVISSLHYYVIGDPLNLLSIFVPKSGTEYLYSALVFLRMYFSGITFIIFCRSMKKTGYATLIGSIIYVFCGFTFFAGVRHPYFLNPMIYLPLILLGIEKIYRKEKAFVFILSIFLSAISNFYFFYMLCVIVFIYAIVRFFDYFKEDYIKNIFMQLVYFIVYYIIGVLCAAFIFLPAVLGFLSGGRGTSGVSLEVFYPFKYNIRFFTQFITSSGALGHWTVLGFGVISFYAIISMFLNKKNRTLKILFVLSTMMLLLPIAGKVMNGLAYVSNRWCFSYSMLIAYIVVDRLPSLTKMGKREKICCFSLMIFYFAYQMILPYSKSYQTLMATIFLAICLCILSLFNKSKHFKLILLIVCMLNVTMNAWLRYSPEMGNYSSQFVTLGKGFTKLNETATSAVPQLNDDTFYRVDRNHFGEGDQLNAELQLGVSRSAFHYSVVNGALTTYLNENGLGNRATHTSGGLAGRAMLESLASVKYFVAKEGNSQYVPYGYTFNSVKTIGENEIKYNVYENRYQLPLGYTYDTYITKEEYDELSMEEKQQATLQSIVLEEESKIVDKGNLLFTNQQFDATFSYSKREIVMSQGKIRVKKNGAKLEVEIPEVTDGELYVKFANLWFSPRINSKGSYARSSRLRFTSENMSKSFNYMLPEHQFYSEQQNYLVNMNIQGVAQKKITITFQRAGEYTFDDFSIVYQPMDDYETQINKLRMYKLEDVVLEEDNIKGSITTEQNSLLCLSIPYSKGWSAFVNGKEVKVLKANTMYMALEVEPGTHSIELIYHTPGFKLGCMLSILGLISLWGYDVYYNKLAKRDKEN